MLFKKSERGKVSWSLRRCADNIKIDVIETEWIYLAQVSDQWRTVAKKLMKLTVP